MRACAESLLRGCPQAALLLLEAVRRGGVGVGAGGGGASNYNGVREIGGGGAAGSAAGARGGLDELLPHLGAALRARRGAARPLGGGGGEASCMTADLPTAAMRALALPWLGDSAVSPLTDAAGLGSTTSTRGAETVALPPPRCALVSLCASLHELLMLPVSGDGGGGGGGGGGEGRAANADRAKCSPEPSADRRALAQLAEAARVAAAVAPLAALQLLAVAGRWQELVEAGVAVGSLPHALRLLREAGPHTAALLTRPPAAPPPPPRQWARWLGCLAADGGGESCSDGRWLLKLALLPRARQAAATVAERQLGAAGSSPSKRRAAERAGQAAEAAAAVEAAETAARLEVFCQHWLALGWPRDAMRAELRLQLPAAASGLCELLERRPALLRDLPLGPELLLDAIGLVAGLANDEPLPPETEAVLSRLALPKACASIAI